MSAIVQQLSYNINEKLHLDDRTFTQFEARGNAEHPVRSTSSTTSFSTNEPTEKWTASAVTSTSAPISSEDRLVGTSKLVVGQTGQRFDHHRLLSIHRYEMPSSALPKSKTKDTMETTLYKLSDKNFQTAFFTSNQQEKVQTSKSSDFNVRCTGKNTQETESFPSIVGRSCTLHPQKDQNHPTGSSFVVTDVPPIKKHCRSVSELDEIPSSWKPSTQSRVWVPIQRLRSTRKSFSSFPCSGRVGDCSRSLDCGSLQMTPPSSPVPRPASVTVIKQEGGAWTFLSSQNILSEQPTAFSPLGLTSPLSRLQTMGSRASTHSGLSATKRSLSFSADFEHRESIEYTPASTPEFGKRNDFELKRGGLLRCQSHPSGLNIKRGKCRRRTRLSNNRPTLDFAKMKQTSFAKCRSDEHNRSSASNKAGFALSNDIGQLLSVNPVFPSIINTDNSLKKNKAKHLEPVRCLSPTSLPVSFSIGCGKPLSDIEHRIPSPTDEAPNEPDDEIGGGEIEVDTTSGGISSTFISECPDLNVDEIENEDDV